METTPEPVRLLKATAAWLKQRLLFAFGAIGAAVTLLGNLEPFLELANIVQFIVERWREWTRGLWHWLGSFVYLQLSAKLADTLTFIAFSSAAMVRSNIARSIFSANFRKSEFHEAMCTFGFVFLFYISSIIIIGWHTLSHPFLLSLPVLFILALSTLSKKLFPFIFLLSLLAVVVGPTLSTSFFEETFPFEVSAHSFLLSAYFLFLLILFCWKVFIKKEEETISAFSAFISFLSIYIIIFLLLVLNYMGLYSNKIMDFYSAAPWRD